MFTFSKIFLTYDQSMRIMKVSYRNTEYIGMQERMVLWKEHLLS